MQEHFNVTRGGNGDDDSVRGPGEGTPRKEMTEQETEQFRQTLMKTQEEPMKTIPVDNQADPVHGEAIDQ